MTTMTRETTLMRASVDTLTAMDVDLAAWLTSGAASEVLEAAGVDPQARGEVLEVGDFARVAEQLNR